MSIDKGFTMIELMIVLTIAALLLTMTAAQYREWIAAYQLANVAQQLASSLNYARSEAMRRGYRVNLCRSADGRQCAATADWSNGWLVFVDSNRDGQVAVDEPVLRVETPAAAGIQLSGNRPVESYVSYTSLGNARLVNGALQMGTFTLCRAGQRSVRVVLANSGRVRTETTQDVCP